MQRPEKPYQSVGFGHRRDPVSAVDDFPIVDRETDLKTLIAAIDAVTNPAMRRQLRRDRRRMGKR
jgi:hypothetical protein